MTRHVDPVARRQAAELIRRFRDCELTNDQFEDAYYPLLSDAADRAIKAMASAIWFGYDDTREHVLADGRELPAELRTFLDRCVLFMQSSCPYAWERDQFLSPPWLQALRQELAEVIGLPGLAGRNLSGLRPGPKSAEDWNIWPFSSLKQLREVEASAARGGPEATVS